MLLCEGFQDSSLGLHERIPLTWNKDKRRTVVSILIYKGTHLVLVHPSVVPPDYLWWISPQGGVEEWDMTLNEATLRETHEELTLGEKNIVTFGMRTLGEFSNPVPSNRARGITIKHLCFVGVPVKSLRGIRLNRENRGFVLVDSPLTLNALMSRVAEERPGKFRATCSALQRAHDCGMLSWAPLSY